MQEAILELSSATKSFRQRTVLDALNFSLPRGAAVGLLGKNGAGKTTLLKCAVGLLQLDSGGAFIFDEPASDLSSETKARIGYVPQEPEMSVWMRSRQLVDYISGFYPRWNHDLVSELLHDWEVPTDTKVRRLSVGERQKLSIILAMGHEPDLLILDEPAAALDPGARRQFLQTIIEVICREGTVLFSTHLTSDLERVAERVAILKDGRFVFDDMLDKLKERVRRIHLTSRNPLPAGFAVPNALQVQAESNQAVVTINDSDTDVAQNLARQFEAQVSETPLSLEDIFMELHR